MMAGSFAALYYHIVFSTKDRRPLLPPDIAPRIHQYFGGAIRGIDGIPVIVGGMPDHLHILTAFSKSMAITDALREIKTESSKWISRSFPQLSQFAWQEGYGTFSISVAGIDRVKAYIAGQEEHHRTVTFQEEFLDFLRRHQIAYDERYIWK